MEAGSSDTRILEQDTDDRYLNSHGPGWEARHGVFVV